MSAPGILSSAEQDALKAAFFDYSPATEKMEAHLRGVLNQVLGNPGNLTRAQLIFKILCLYGESPTQSMKLACGIEYFHSASLIFDDMPNMDDAMQRRGKACVHHVFGEASSVLGALALITRAYALIWDVINSRPWHERQRASEYLEQQIGASGILNGQSADIHFRGDENLTEKVTEIAMGKTVSLIRLSLVFPAMLGGANQTTLNILDQLSVHWGLAYQAIDDWKDTWMESLDTGKTTNRDFLLSRPNLYHAAGKEQSESLIRGHLNQSSRLMAELSSQDTGKIHQPQNSNWLFLNSLQGYMEETFHSLTFRALVA